MTLPEALQQRQEAHKALGETLRGLPHGRGRRDALRTAHEAGVSAIELSEHLGVTRQRVYWMLNKP